MKKFRDDDMDDFVPPKNLGYFVNTIPVSTYTVFLNEAIVSPVYYTDVVNIKTLTEHEHAHHNLRGCMIIKSKESFAHRRPLFLA